MPPLSSNWKVRSTPVAPFGGLNWQLQQDSNRAQMLRRKIFRNLLAEACWGFGYRSASLLRMNRFPGVDRKSTRLNSSHLVISYAVFCLKKKKLKITQSS